MVGERVCVMMESENGEGEGEGENGDVCTGILVCYLMSCLLSDVA